MSEETHLGATGTTFVRLFLTHVRRMACCGDEPKTATGILQDGDSRYSLAAFHFFPPCVKIAIFSLLMSMIAIHRQRYHLVFFLFFLLTRRLDAWTTTSRSTCGCGCRTLRPALTSRRQDPGLRPATIGPIASSSRRQTTREETCSTRGNRRYVRGNGRFMRVSTGEGACSFSCFLFFFGLHHPPKTFLLV